VGFPHARVTVVRPGTLVAAPLWPRFFSRGQGGEFNVNVAPLPIPALSARTHPPWAVTMAFANARLSPVPPGVVHRIGDGERPEKLWRQLWRKPLPVSVADHGHPLRCHTDIESDGFHLPGELQRIVHQDMNHFPR
jgi:hypothetical protein